MANEFSDDTLLARWLSGELTEAEQKELESRSDFADFERIAKAGAQLRAPAYDAGAELARLQQRQEEIKVNAKAGKQPARSPLRAIRYWAAAAAAVATLIFAWFVLQPAPPQEIFAAAGTPITTTNLHDGSFIQLNADSYFKFEVAEKRLGTLKGEGFFEVEKSEVPFVVATEFGTVTVLGTSFNIYARAGDFRVACTTGKVRVAFNGTDETVDLIPGQSVARVAAGAINRFDTDKESTLDWLDRRSVFKSQPLSAVIAELERQFDVEVKLPGNLNVGVTTNTDFSNTNLDLALAKVFDPIPGVSYRKEDRIVSVTKR